MSADPPVLALRGARVRFGARPLFDRLDLALGPRERACLVGRNGGGKSTVLKALAGLIELDAGERFVQPGLRVAYLPQDQTFAAGETVAGFVAAGLAESGVPPEAEGGPTHHLVDKVLARLDLDGRRPGAELSGGEARRAALARALAGAPDVLLLDEPTNHLDLPTIEWLERHLAAHAGAVLIVSHDRAFLTRLSRRTFWLEGGVLRRLEDGFAAFEPWSEKVLADEEKEARRLDRRIADEVRWLHRGITARRKRNQGRLRRLERMRRERAGRARGPAYARLEAGAEYAGRLVVDAQSVSKSFPGGAGREETVIVRDFSTRVLKGDRVGMIGPNGSGKTTLLRLLVGELAPDAGRVRLGANVKPAVFDQKRSALRPDWTPWRILCPAGGDTVNVRGRPRHVVGYLKDFLFDERQAQSPVASLSGGERNRLLLARVLAQPSNLLVLDEPTNDLDMDTLDLLQEMLAEYDGTALVVSHDRDFLDRVVTSIIAVEGGGRIEEYVGGYRDYLRQRGAAPAAPAPDRGKAKGRGRAAAGRGRRAAEQARRARLKLGYREQRELERLPGRIEALGAEIRDLEARLADPASLGHDADALAEAAAAHGRLRAELAAAEARWLELESRREEFAAAKAAQTAAGPRGAR